MNPTPSHLSPTPQAPQVRHFRQNLLWPLRLMPLPRSAGVHARPWEVLQAMAGRSPWRPVLHDHCGEDARLAERHYNEFVSFLPYVQRFLYGEGRDPRGDKYSHGSPMRQFRRHDIAAVRLTPRPGDAPITLQVARADLYFFLDVDLVLFNLELCGNGLSLEQAQELLYRFGRAYPGGWDAQGEPQHCLTSAEWLDIEGQVLARSDAHQRETFLAHVAEHRAPRIAAHWATMLEPLVGDHSGKEGALRYRQIEYYRMPVMAYLALDDPQALSRADFVRLGLVTGAGQALPYADDYLADFEQRYCYDRFWCDSGAAPRTRYLCSGHALVVVGDAGAPFFADAERGVLAQFRHQHFLLFLIAHFQKAALMMSSDKLVEALKDLDIGDADSVRRFKRSIRGSFESFLRFTHRYWFHEISEQAQMRALWHMSARHLELDPLYCEVKERIADMASYLESDSLRRQANTVVRLTVVTIFGLVGTVTTGFLGMNLLAEADAPLSRRLTIFALVFLATTALTVYTMVKSKRLSDFLDVLSDERATAWQKCLAFAAVWRRER